MENKELKEEFEVWLQRGDYQRSFGSIQNWWLDKIIQTKQQEREEMATLIRKGKKMATRLEDMEDYRNFNKGLEEAAKLILEETNL